MPRRQHAERDPHAPALAPRDAVLDHARAARRPPAPAPPRRSTPQAPAPNSASAARRRSCRPGSAGRPWSTASPRRSSTPPRCGCPPSALARPAAPRPAAISAPRSSRRRPPPRSPPGRSRRARSRRSAGSAAARRASARAARAGSRAPECRRRPASRATAAADRTAPAAPGWGSSGPGWRSPSATRPTAGMRADHTASGRLSTMPSTSAAIASSRCCASRSGARDSASRKSLTPPPPARRSRRICCARAPRPALAPRRRPRRASRRAGRGVGDDPPLVHHQHAVGEDQRLGHVVRDHDRGQPEPIVQRADRRAELVARHRVERAERLVHQQQLRARSPARAPRRRAGAARPTVHRASGRRNRRGRSTRASSSATRAVGSASPSSRKPIATFSADGHVREQPDILEHVTDPPPQPERIAVRHVRAVDRDRPGARLDQPVDRLEQGRLARPRTADQRDEAAPGDVDRDVIDRDRAARIGLGHAVQGDRADRLGSRRSLASRARDAG